MVTTYKFYIAMNRSDARYHVRWKLALLCDEGKRKRIYHGRTHDLTLVGTGMLTHRNLFCDSEVVVLLAIPPLHQNLGHNVIEIQAHQIYSVYSGDTSCFRLGLEFLSFKDDGLEVLKEALSHYRPIIESRDGETFPTNYGSFGDSIPDPLAEPVHL